MAAPNVSQTGIIFPDDYTPQTENVQKLIIEKWNKSYPDKPFQNFTDITNEWILDKVGLGLNHEEAMDDLFSVLAEGISDSTGFDADSMQTLLQGAFLDIHYDKTVLNPVLEKQEIEKAKFDGTLFAMENSRRQFEIVQTRDIKRKQNELQRIKSLYDLDDDASMDDAFSKLLEDLSAGELQSIYTGGSLLPGKKYTKDIYDKTGNVVDEVELKYEDMLPIPLATKEYIPGPGGGIKTWSPGMLVDAKFTEESFQHHLYQTKREELINLAKTSGAKIDYFKLNQVANVYAEERAEKGFEIYQNYQREALKDLSSDDILLAITRLEADKEYNRQIEGIFTDDKFKSKKSSSDEAMKKADEAMKRADETINLYYPSR